MFKKLKWKFVIINMALLSFVFIAIFTVIYMLTAVSGERQLTFTLDRIMNMPPKPSGALQRPSPGDPNMATSLVVELDREGSIINSSSFVAIEEETVKEAVLKAKAYPKASGDIKVGDFYYAFLKRHTNAGMKIVFVDRGPLRENLINILFIFITSGVVSLILLFLISVYLANRTIEPIKEAFIKQQQFIADASHELKTPLTIIKTNLAVVTGNENETVKSQSKWLGFIYSQTERMSNLINDMLSLARMDSMEQTLYMHDFNLSKAVDGVLLSFEAAIFESGIGLVTELKPDIFIKGNRESFERLINILLDNAVKNTPRGGTISVHLFSDKSSIKIVVKNTGPGIPAENIDKIFERFYRVDASRARESGGYGLGLAIAKSIVQKHHGKIYARSKVGIETSFIVELSHGTEHVQKTLI